MIYKDKKDIKYSVRINIESGIIDLLFTSDCGKFGTDEIIDSFRFTHKELLKELQNSYEDKDAQIEELYDKKESYRKTVINLSEEIEVLKTYLDHKLIEIERLNNKT